MSTSSTSNQVKAYLNAIAAIADAIKALGRVPSGELYASVMAHMDLATYEGMIATLVAAKLVEKTGSHELIWKGPVV